MRRVENHCICLNKLFLIYLLSNSIFIRNVMPQVFQLNIDFSSKVLTSEISLNENSYYL